VQAGVRGRRLRYCDRPPFALDRPRKLDPEHLRYKSTKQGAGGNGPQILTPLQPLNRLVALVPPPCVHRHRYFDAPARTTAYWKFSARPRPSGRGR